MESELLVLGILVPRVGDWCTENWGCAIKSIQGSNKAEGVQVAEAGSRQKHMFFHYASQH